MAAACVQATPIRSTYMWQGKLASHEETLLSIKTLQSAYPKVQSLIREAHSYDTPEIIAQPVTGVSMSYIDWVASQVDPD